MESRIQVLKGPFNILQLAQEKRNQFTSPGLFNSTSGQTSLENRKSDSHFVDFVSSDTTVTVSIAAVPNYPPVKTEVPSHGFSVTIPNNCTETEGHVGVFDRQLSHNGVQFSPSTQSRTPPDSTFSESFKDGSQEVCVSIPLFLNPANALQQQPPSSRPLLPSRLLSDLSHQTIGYSPDPTEPVVGSAFPGFILTCQNSGQCVITPLSHQHNKVLYLSPTIAKAFSLSSLFFNPEGNYLREK